MTCLKAAQVGDWRALTPALFEAIDECDAEAVTNVSSKTNVGGRLSSDSTLLLWPLDTKQLFNRDIRVISTLSVPPLASVAVK